MGAYLYKLHEYRVQRRAQLMDDGFSATPAAECTKRALLGEVAPEHLQATKILKGLSEKLYNLVPKILVIVRVAPVLMVLRAPTHTLSFTRTTTSWSSLSWRGRTWPCAIRPWSSSSRCWRCSRWTSV